MKIKNQIKTFLTNFHKHKKTDSDIFIFSLPRSGSTLLAEILNIDPNAKLASESFSLKKDNIEVLRRYFNYDFLSERYVDVSDNDFKQIIKYYEDLSIGKNFNSYYWSDFFKSQHSFKTNRTIFKIHKFTYYFDDFMKHFKNDFGIYLIRNPISHSISRMNKGWADYTDLFYNSNKIKEVLPEKAKIKINQVKKNGNSLEKFVITWCLENYIFIQQYQENSLHPNIYPVFYEKLVLDPERTIIDLCDRIDLGFNKKMVSALNIPSSGIIHSSKETKKQIKNGNRNYLVERWREDVNNSTIDRVKEILNSFEIDLYLKEL